MSSSLKSGLIEFENAIEVAIAHWKIEKNSFEGITQAVIAETKELTLRLSDVKYYKDSVADALVEITQAIKQYWQDEQWPDLDLSESTLIPVF